MSCSTCHHHLIQIAGLVGESTVDGSGIRFAIFTQGCPHNCPECHNPQTHDMTGGRTWNVDCIKDLIKKNPLLKGITLTGGEPFCQVKSCAELAKYAHSIGLDVWTYTGYTFEQITSGIVRFGMELLKETDVLVDGPFINSKKDLELLFRGSSNQRIINVKKSLETKSIVLKYT